MKKGLRLWFYLEAILGIIAGVLFVVTLINQQWIETVFSVDPDQGSGALEWLVEGGQAVVAIALGLAARYEWRRATVVAARGHPHSRRRYRAIRTKAPIPSLERGFFVSIALGWMPESRNSYAESGSHY